MTQAQYLELLETTIQNYCRDHLNFSFNPEKPVVHLHEPTFNHQEIFAALATLLSTYTTMGKKVKAFEKQYAEYVQMQYGVMSNSGSSANLLSVAALANPVTPNHLKAGDEVIVPALSWATTIWPLVQHQLTPVLVDCRLDDFNLDVQQLEQALSPRTKAIKLVHVYGNPCQMDAIVAFAKQHNLFLIEDCCEAMGATYHGKPVGSFGDISNFSFFFSHHISTMEGGISVTNDFNIAETLRILRAHGWSREADEHQKYVKQHPEIDPRFIFINSGYNLRPTEVNAAIGQYQLPKLEAFIKNRRETAAYFMEAFKAYNDYFEFQQETANSEHVWFGFPLLVKETAPFQVKDLTTYLNQHHIETRPIIAGNMAKHPGLNFYPHRIVGSLKNADQIMQRGFAIPCHHAVCPQARNYIMNIIADFVGETINQPIAKLA